MPVLPILDVTEVRAHDTDDREHRPQLVFHVSPDLHRSGWTVPGFMDTGLVGEFVNASIA